MNYNKKTYRYLKASALMFVNEGGGGGGDKSRAREGLMGWVEKKSTRNALKEAGAES